MSLEYLYFIIELGIIAIVLIGFTLLLGITLAVRDFSMILNKPFIFALETLAMAFIPAVPLLFFVVTRGISISMAIKWFLGLTVKFGVLHVLFQTSGFYSYMFAPTATFH